MTLSLTVEMPNGEAMVKFATALSATGNVRTTTVRAYTPDEFGKLTTEAPIALTRLRHSRGPRSFANGRGARGDPTLPKISDGYRKPSARDSAT